MAGPKRPHDCVLLSNIKKDFYNCIEAPKGFKGFGLSENGKQLKFDLKIDGQDVTLKNGSILLCSITACTNTGNHSGILAAGLLAKRAVEKGLQVRKGIKTSFSPGTGANTKYLEKAGLNVFLDALGLYIYFIKKVLY
jgi:aconitate hydratase